jgi:hypothetical protein
MSQQERPAEAGRSLEIGANPLACTPFRIPRTSRPGRLNLTYHSEMRPRYPRLQVWGVSVSALDARYSRKFRSGQANRLQPKQRHSTMASPLFLFFYNCQVDDRGARLAAVPLKADFGWKLA